MIGLTVCAAVATAAIVAENNVSAAAETINPPRVYYRFRVIEFDRSELDEVQGGSLGRVLEIFDLRKDRDGDGFEGAAIPVKGPLILNAGDERVDIGSWSREAESDLFEVIATPGLISEEGITAGAFIGQPIEFFEHVGEGAYRLRQPRGQREGLNLSVHTEKLTKDSVSVRDLHAETTIIERREPVEGTELDVGRPVLISRMQGWGFELELGETVTLLLPTALGHNGDPILLVMTANLYEPG